MRVPTCTLLLTLSIADVRLAASLEAKKYTEKSYRGCEGVDVLPTVPFIRIAEYDGTKNFSVDDWATKGRLQADDDNILIICFDRMN